MRKKKVVWQLLLLMALILIAALPAYSAKKSELSFALTTDPKSIDPRTSVATITSQSLLIFPKGCVNTI